MLVASLFGAAGAMQGPYSANVVRIRVHLDQRLSSQDAHTGDTFAFDTSSSIEVDGEFLPAHSHGKGVVVQARSAKGPQPGLLVLEARTLELPDGKPLAVGLAAGSLDVNISGDVRSYPADGTVSAGRVPFAIGAGRSTNVVYEKGTEFIVEAPPPASPDPEPEASATG